MPTPKLNPSTPDWQAFTVDEQVVTKTTRKGGAKAVTNVKVPGGKIYPEASAFPKACLPPGKDEKKRAAGGALRSCHIEFVLLGDKHAKTAGVEPGPYLRFCQSLKQKAPLLVRVKDHREAQVLSKRVCACKKSSGDIEKCARDAAASGLSGRRRR